MTLKVLLVGLGGVGQRHARNLRTLLGDSAELLAYRTRRTSTVLTEKMGVEHGAEIETKLGLRVFTDLSLALLEKPDAVVISNPTSLHIDVAQAAAEAGCHLFVEKPLSHSFDGIPELLSTVAEKELVAFVGYQLRFHPCLLALKELLAASTIGPVISVRAAFGEYLPGWHPYEDYRQSYAARRELGGGVVLTQIHDFDYLTWLFGWPKRVFSMGGKLSSLEIDVEDTASTLLECFENERTIPVHLHQDLVQRQPVRQCEVIGEQGKIIADLRRGTLQVLEANGNIQEVCSFEALERNQLFLDEMKHFLTCIRERTKPCVTLRDGANSLRVALASLKSMSAGRAIAFTPL